MKNKTKMIAGLIIVLTAVGSVWFYFNQNLPVSFQFKGTTLEIRDGSLILIGGYIESGQDDPMAGDSRVVTVFFGDNTKIIKNTIKVEGDSGFDKPAEPADQQQKTATIAELKSDLEKNNLVLTVSANDNIYNLDTFAAASIEYTALIFK